MINSYLCAIRVITLKHNNEELRNTNGCYLVTQFSSSSTNRLILSELSFLAKVIKKYELLFESAEVSRLKQMVESGNFQSIDTLQRAVGHKAGAKLTLFIDADHNFATAQVSEFIPFDYEPVMSPMSYEGEVVKTIATLVTSGT